MSHSQDKEFEQLEHELRHIDRLTVLKQKIGRESKFLAKQKKHVQIAIVENTDEVNP